MFRRLDPALIMTVLLIFGIGLLLQYSASYQKDIAFIQKPVVKQLLWFLLSLFASALILYFGYRKIITLAYPIYVAVIILLIVVLIFGRERLGAVRWIEIGGFNFQPSEFTKLALILAVAYYLGHKGEEVLKFRNFIIPFFMTAIPAVLIMKQPDLGTSIVLFPIFISILFMAGARLKYIAGFFVIGFLSMPFIWNMLRGYQKQRLLVFINPNTDPLGAGYTIIQSKIAVGSGRLFGKGWLSGTQNQLNFLPVRHTDFVFSAAGEEWGFIGCLILLGLYLFLIKRMSEVINIADNIYGRLLVTGIVTMIAFQIIVNIGMTIGLLPVVGLTLPLISYGGSSLLITMMAISLLLSVNQRQ